MNGEFWFVVILSVPPRFLVEGDDEAAMFTSPNSAKAAANSNRFAISHGYCVLTESGEVAS